MDSGCNGYRRRSCLERHDKWGRRTTVGIGVAAVTPIAPTLGRTFTWRRVHGDLQFQGCAISGHRIEHLAEISDRAVRCPYAAVRNLEINRPRGVAGNRGAERVVNGRPSSGGSGYLLELSDRGRALKSFVPKRLRSSRTSTKPFGTRPVVTMPSRSMARKNECCLSGPIPAVPLVRDSAPTIALDVWSSS